MLALLLLVSLARAQQFGQQLGQQYGQLGQQQVFGQPQPQGQPFGPRPGGPGDCRLKMTDTTVPPCMRDVYGDDGIIRDGLGQASCRQGDSRTMLAPTMTRQSLMAAATAVWSGGRCQEERRGPPPMGRRRRQAGFPQGRPPPPFAQGAFPPPPPGGGFGGPPGGGGRGIGLTCSTYTSPGKGKCLQSSAQANTTAIMSLLVEAPDPQGDPRMKIVATNGIPSHCYNRAARGFTPNYACEHYRTLRVYREPPSLASWPSRFYGLPMGPAGISVSGAFLYNHLSGEPQCKTAAVTESQTFDPCDGHADPECRYHYHKAPVCIDGFNRCDRIIGWLLDGIPAYGKCSLRMDGRLVTLTSCYAKQPGKTGCDPSQFNYTISKPGCNLDMANGFYFRSDAFDPATGRKLFSAKQYAYFFTPEYPFIMPGTTSPAQKMCIVEPAAAQGTAAFGTRLATPIG